MDGHARPVNPIADYSPTPMGVDDVPNPNDLPRRARLRLPSPSGPGRQFVDVEASAGAASDRVLVQTGSIAREYTLPIRGGFA